MRKAKKLGALPIEPPNFPLPHIWASGRRVQGWLRFLPICFLTNLNSFVEFRPGKVLDETLLIQRTIVSPAKSLFFCRWCSCRITGASEYLRAPRHPQISIKSNP